MKSSILQVLKKRNRLRCGWLTPHGTTHLGVAPQGFPPLASPPQLDVLPVDVRQARHYQERQGQRWVVRCWLLAVYAAAGAVCAVGAAAAAVGPCCLACRCCVIRSIGISSSLAVAVVPICCW